MAAIGTLPLPQMHRSIVIHMARRDGRRQLTRLDKDDPDTKADLNIAYRLMFRWARDAELALDPPAPLCLRGVAVVAARWCAATRRGAANITSAWRQQNPLPYPLGYSPFSAASCFCFSSSRLPFSRRNAIRRAASRSDMGRSLAFALVSAAA